MISQSIASSTGETRTFRYTLYSPHRGSRFLFMAFVVLPLMLTIWTFNKLVGMDGLQLFIALLVALILLLNTFFFILRANLFGTNHVLLIEDDHFFLLKGTRVLQEEWIGNLQMCYADEESRRDPFLYSSLLIRSPRFLPIRIEAPWRKDSGTRANIRPEEMVLTTATAAEWNDLRQLLCMIENRFYEEDYSVK